MLSDDTFMIQHFYAIIVYSAHNWVLYIIYLYFLSPADKVSVPYSAYCPFDISWKDVFAWRFILNENLLF